MAHGPRSFQPSPPPTLVRTLAPLAPLALVAALAATLPGARSAAPASQPGVPLPAAVGADWWSAVQRDLAASEYHLTPAAPASQASGAAGGYQAPNRAQNFRTRFTAEGVRVTPRAARAGDAPAWEWGLTLAAWGRGGGPFSTSPATPEVVADGNRIEYRRDGLTEWYVNDARGLEQGFTITRRPDGEPGARAGWPWARPGPRTRLRVEMAVSGGLTMVLAEDRQAVDFIAPGGARAIRFDHLHVVDARQRVLEAEFVPSSGADSERLAIVVDDRNAEYPIVIDPLATSPDWTAESDQAESHFGYAVATAGDVNGDGFSDLIVGARYYDNGEHDEGRAYVFHGSASGPSMTPNWTAESDQAESHFSYAVATAGDVNGDGYSDVIIGALFYDSGESDEGRAFVYHGSASGLGPNGTPGNADWIAESDQVGGNLGIAVGPAGDVNGDGYADVIVGAHTYDNGQTNEGRAYVYHGSTGGLAAGPAWTAEGDQGGARFGNSAGTAGDVNGDGYSDVIVGAYGYDNGQGDEGRAFVYHGSAGGLAASPSWTAESDEVGAYFGWSVGTAGDVNGDGLSDVIVGAFLADVGPTADQGGAFVYHGSATGLAGAPWAIEGLQAGAHLGYAVATAGDVNGDGYADVIVGARLYDNGESDEGRAFVHHGSAGGLSLTANWTAESNQADSHFGYAVGTAGDVNGDGFSDVIVGARYYDNGEHDEGRAFVHPGSASGPSLTPKWTAQGDQAVAAFGFSVASAGDVNGDGYGDVIVGAPKYDGGQQDEGRAYVYYGAAGSLSPTPSWIAESDQALADFGLSVASAGDVNGDGYGDVIVGAESFDDGESQEGRVFVWYGSEGGLGANGTPANAGWSAEGNLAGARVGHSVASAGDVNGDGYGDVVVGAHLLSNPENHEGGAFVWHGSASGLTPGGTPANADWSIESNQDEGELGFSVATAGDVNGDGYSDVIVGALGGDADTPEGKALVYHGSASGLSATANWSAESNQDHALLGHSVASAGDVNGDGYSDVIIGAPRFANPESGSGMVFLYEGAAIVGLGPDGTPANADWSALSAEVFRGFGYSVASAGDVNGDGYSDVIVGSLTLIGGRALVWHGSTSGLGPDGTPANADWSAEGDLDEDNFGRVVASAGDVNGDGYGDIIVGASSAFQQGRAFVYYGNDGSTRVCHPRQLRADGVTPIAPLGRPTPGPYFRIRADMLSIYGRTRLETEYEVKPFGTPLDGSATIRDAFADVGDDGVLPANRLISDLTADSLYHWRVRARYDLAKTPFQPNGPWVHMPTNGWNEADLRASTDVTGVAAGRPSIFELQAAGANPGRGQCGVQLVLPRAARVRAEVLDVHGRTVAVLAHDQGFPAGSHRLTWNGRDHAGTAAAAGIYFVRARVNGDLGARKVVLQR